LSTLRQYLVGVAVAFVLLICAAAGLLAYQVDRFGRAQAERQLLETTRALSLVADGELRRNEAILQALRNTESARTGDWRSLERQARLLFSGGGAWVVVGDRAGRQLVNTRLPPSAPLGVGTMPEEVWPILDQGRSRICNLGRGLVERHILCVDVPIMRNGTAAYHLSAVMRPDRLRTVIEPQRLQTGSFLTVLDRKGIVIWRNVGADRFVGGPGTPDLLRALSSSSEGVLESRSLEGVPTVVAYSRSTYSGWTFVVALPRAQLRAGITKTFAIGGLIALGLLLLAIVTALAAARRISSAVSRLSQSNAVLGTGDATGYQPTGMAEFDAVGFALSRAAQERHLSAERQNLLINELNHRVKNTLAVVQSIAHQTLRRADAPPALIDTLEARLAALSAAHNVLTRESWSSAGMREIVEDAIAPFCGSDRCQISGPELRISPAMAVGLALTVHELATNAVKYGALSNGDGRIVITWSASAGRLIFDWIEENGPEVRTPGRKGFGTRLLERGVGAELGGTASLSFGKTGVRYSFEAPLPRAEAQSSSDEV
jgi:two-component sensor histidine kinase